MKIDVVVHPKMLRFFDVRVGSAFVSLHHAFEQSGIQEVVASLNLYDSFLVKSVAHGLVQTKAAFGQPADDVHGVVASVAFRSHLDAHAVVRCRTPRPSWIAAFHIAADWVVAASMGLAEDQRVAASSAVAFHCSLVELADARLGPFVA